MSRSSDLRCDFKSTFIPPDSDMPSNHVLFDARYIFWTIFDTAMAMISIDSASVRCFPGVSTIFMLFTIYIMGMKGACISLLLERTLMTFLSRPYSFWRHTCNGSLYSVSLDCSKVPSHSPMFYLSRPSKLSDSFDVMVGILPL